MDDPKGEASDVQGWYSASTHWFISTGHSWLTSFMIVRVHILTAWWALSLSGLYEFLVSFLWVVILWRYILESHLFWVNGPSWITLIRSEGDAYIFQLDFTKQNALLMSTKIMFSTFWDIFIRNVKNLLNCSSNQANTSCLHILKPEHTIIFIIFPTRLWFRKRLWWPSLYRITVISTSNLASTGNTMKKMDMVPGTKTYNMLLSSPHNVTWLPRCV